MATSTQSAWLEVGQIFEHLFPEISVMFVTDPAVPTSINVATMLAAVRGGLVATPATAAQIPPNTTCLKGVPYRILRRSEIAYRGWVARSSRTAVTGAANDAPVYQTENGERTARARDTRAFTR